MSNDTKANSADEDIIIKTETASIISKKTINEEEYLEVRDLI